MNAQQDSNSYLKACLSGYITALVKFTASSKALWGVLSMGKCATKVSGGAEMSADLESKLRFG